MPVDSHWLKIHFRLVCRMGVMQPIVLSSVVFSSLPSSIMLTPTADPFCWVHRNVVCIS